MSSSERGIAIVMLLCTGLLAACERERRSMSARSWWCFPDTLCFAERDQCQRAAQLIDPKLTCNARPTAVCRRGCEAPASPGAQPLCGPKCAVNRSACEMLKPTTLPCREEQPPERPEIFDYSTPGFWCYEFDRGAAGKGSWCTKDKEECEWILDDTLRKLGGTREALGSAGALTGCSVPRSPVYCWSRRVDGQIAIVCTLSREFCEQTRAAPITVPDGHTVTDIQPCEQWIDR
jgi:hypothetical protein